MKKFVSLAVLNLLYHNFLPSKVKIVWQILIKNEQITFH